MNRFLFIIISFFSLAQVAFSAEITLISKAEVSGSVIRLGDIADFNLESSIAEALASVLVGQAPPPGEKLSIRSINIKRNLIKTKKVPLHLNWEGPGTVVVHRTGMKFDAERVQEIINEYLANNSAIFPDAKISFTPQSLPLPFFLPLGKLVYEVVPSHPGIIGSSRFSIIFKVDNSVVKNMSVRGKLEVLGEVVVAAHSLKRGSLLRPRDLTTAIIDLGRSLDIARDPAELVGKKLKKSVQAGSPITQKIVESLPIIYRGQKVKIVLSTGSLFLTATGLAHSDGKLEEMIRVQNLSSNKILYCRVAAPGLVEVML